MRVSWFALLCVGALASRSFAVTFSVEQDSSLPSAGGRLVVFLSAGVSGSSPLDDLDAENPQPCYGMDVAAFAPSASVVVDDNATAFPAPPSQLAPGWYRAAAVLITRREHSRWQSDPGNLFSDLLPFQVKAGENRSIALKLSHVVQPRIWPKDGKADLFEVRSRLLSDFLHHDVVLRAGVIHPIHEDPQKQYAAVYDIPGFGGDHFRALRIASSPRPLDKNAAALSLWSSAFHMVLDPESANGHTLFLNSDNNGPCGDALVKELIPELERRYHLIPRPEARLLRGHSSGGFSTLMLALHYPDTFGATWSASPDPVDFQHFQRCDLYGSNMYANDAGEIPSARFSTKVTLTVRQENAIEQVLGPQATSAQQWASWQAAFGHRLANGQIAPLYDPITGKLDANEAAHYRRFDLLDGLRHDPHTYLPFFQQRVHLVVGDADDYFLNEPVAELKRELDRMGMSGEGYVKIVPKADHTTIYGTAEMEQFPAEMLRWLHNHGI